MMSSSEEPMQFTTEERRLSANSFDDGVKRREEAKREAATDPVARWEAVQQFMAWAASQSTAPRMTPAACKAKERRLLAGMAGMLDNKAAEE